MELTCKCELFVVEQARRDAIAAWDEFAGCGCGQCVETRRGLEEWPTLEFLRRNYEAFVALEQYRRGKDAKQ